MRDHGWRARRRIAFALGAGPVTVLYVFRCPAAGHDIEQFHHMGLAPATVICDEHNAEAKRIPAKGNFEPVPGAHEATYRKF